MTPLWTAAVIAMVLTVLASSAHGSTPAPPMAITNSGTYCTDASRCGQLAQTLNRKTVYRYRSDMLVWLNVVSYTYRWENVSRNGTGAFEVVETVTNRTMRAPFFTRVDQFSQLQLVGSGASYYRNSSARLWVSVGGVRSPMRQYSDGSHYVPYFSAIIQMTNGRVNSIRWDEGCSQCPDSICIGGVNCGNRYTSLQPCFSVECNIKVYLAWSGTATSARQLLSSGFLPSNFRRFSLGNVRREASRVSSSAIANLQDNPGSSSGEGAGSASTASGAGSGSGSATGVNGVRENPTSTGTSGAHTNFGGPTSSGRAE